MRTIFTAILLLISVVLLGQNPEIAGLWEEYSAGQHQLVINKAVSLLESDPQNVDLNLMVGRSYADQGLYKEAIPFLEATAANDKKHSWRKAWALSYLGSCHFMLQNYEDSKKFIKTCIELKATRNVTNNANGQLRLFGYDAFYDTWKIVETGHFRFHFQDMSDREIEIYASRKEAAYQKINEFFNSQLPKKIDYFVWHSREDAMKVLRANLGFARPKYSLVHTFYRQTVGHEMTHVISYYSGEVETITSFINEGTAVCFDQSNQDRWQQVKEWAATNNKKIKVMDFWMYGSEQSDEILYPLAGLFVQELIARFGKEKFLEFFVNQTYENALFVFGSEVEASIKEFEARINE